MNAVIVGKVVKKETRYVIVQTKTGSFLLRNADLMPSDTEYRFQCSVHMSYGTPYFSVDSYKVNDGDSHACTFEHFSNNGTVIVGDVSGMRDESGDLFPCGGGMAYLSHTAKVKYKGSVRSEYDSLLKKTNYYFTVRRIEVVND